MKSNISWNRKGRFYLMLIRNYMKMMIELENFNLNNCYQMFYRKERVN